MSERLPSSAEHDSIKEKELQQEAKEQQERLKENIEKRAEQSKELHTDTAKEAVEKALAARKEKQADLSHEKTEKKRTLKPTKKMRNAQFKKEMTDARAKMSAPSRGFSKLIHAKPVEKASEAIGATIARPNALLAGSLAAFLLTGGLYFWARHVGYPLSGFETIAGFVIGWLIGIIFDYVRIMITGKS